MLNKIFHMAACLMTILSLGALTGCEKDPVTGDPSLKISTPVSTTTSIEFTITPSNATRFEYACITYDDYKAKNFTYTAVENGEKLDLDIQDLKPATSYIITAIPYAGSVKGTEVAVRTSTITEKPTLKVLSIDPLDDGARIKMQTSAGATKIVYSVYSKMDSMVYGSVPGLEDWRKWVEITELKPEGTDIEITELLPNDYWVEAYVVRDAVISDKHIWIPISVTVQDRPYVRIDLNTSEVTYRDAQISLIQNNLCSKYYVGMGLFENFLAENVFATIAGNKAADYLMTEDYKGSVIKLVEKTFKGWAPETVMMLWTVACDADGKFSTDPTHINKVAIHIPKVSYVYGGKGTVDAAITELTTTSYAVSIKPKDCVSYYYHVALKSKLDAEYPDASAIVEKLLMAQPEQKEAEVIVKSELLDPDTEYMLYAIGVDKDGKLGALTGTVIKTKALDFTSDATFTIASKLEPQKVTLTLEPNASCTSMRYIFLSNNDYLKDFDGRYSRAVNALALKKAVGAKDHNFAKDGNVITFNGLKSNSPYVFIALPADANGAMGKMPSDKELFIKTPLFDMTSTASVNITGLTLSGSRLRFSVEASENCNGYYILNVNKKTVIVSPNALVEAIISSTDRIYRGDDFGGTAPKYSYNQTLANTDAYVYILCRDKEGKFNNPMNKYIDVPAKKVVEEGKE